MARIFTGSAHPPAAGAPAPVSSNPKDAGVDVAGRFDPTGLERAAVAVRELEKSSHAGKAFDIVQQQEVTKQKELALKQSEMGLESERAQTARAQAMAQREQSLGEENRKTAQHQQEQERRTMQYKAELESQLYQKKLEDQQKQNEQWLGQQHQQFLQHEEMRKRTDMELEEARRRTLDHQSKLERDTAVARETAKASAETDGRIKQEKENFDIHLRTLRAKAAEERKGALEKFEFAAASIASGFTALTEDRSRMTTVVGGITAVAAGIYGTRMVARVAGDVMLRTIGKPPLVRETSRWTWNGGFRQFFPKKNAGGILDKIVLEKGLADRLQWTTNSLVHTQKHQDVFSNMLLYGPPGTGKTLFARTLATQSGMDYAIMSGGDIGPLGKDAVNELHKLFAWASSRKRGMILFIDESEAFLRKGRAETGANRLSEETSQVLSTFLALTGTENNKIMIVLATNVVEALDPAVLDRVDEQYELPLPGLEQREQIFKMYFTQHVASTGTAGTSITVDEECLRDEFITAVAARTEGMSGRQLSKLCISFRKAAFGSGTNKLSKGMADVVIDYSLSQYLMEERKKALQAAPSASLPRA